ncbi:MAG: HAMP domain-containing sensor histidine kinase [Pseudomonadota bacterium]
MPLSQFILENLDRILLDWEAFAKTIPAAAGMDTTALRNDAAKILTTIAHEMEKDQSPGDQEAKSRGLAIRAPSSAETDAETHSNLRLDSGFNLDEMVSEYRALRATVTRLWTRELPTIDGDALYDLTRFNEGIDQALTESIARYTALREKSRELFLGILGHDLRTPLGVVMTSAEFLLQSKTLTDTQSKVVSRMLRSGERIKGLVSDLLDMTQARLGGELPITRNETDLALTSKEAVDEMRAIHPNGTFSLNASGDLTGLWDSARLTQVIVNLMQNAIQHGAEETPVTVSLRGEQERVLLTVHNEGPPISEWTRQRIFDPLVSGEGRGQPRAAQNLGLGLYIAREIAVAHGGSIDVTSSQEAGTSFTVSLPRR